MLGPDGQPPAGPPVSVYVVSLSGDPGDFRILWPRISDLKLIRFLDWGRLEIRSFSDPAVNAERKVRALISDRARACLTSARRRAGTLLTTGAALFLLGVASFFLPDPLLAVDETILTVGGVSLFLLGIRTRSWITSFRMPPETTVRWREDPLLTSAFRALREKEQTSQSDGSIDDQSRWLVDHVDIPALINSGSMTREEVAQTLAVIGEFIPFRRILHLEHGTGRRAARSRRILRTRLAFLNGLSEDAITVYTELYRSAQGSAD
jgi:hypothetical protein